MYKVKGSHSYTNDSIHKLYFLEMQNPIFRWQNIFQNMKPITNHIRHSPPVYNWKACPALPCPFLRLFKQTFPWPLMHGLWFQNKPCPSGWMFVYLLSEHVYFEMYRHIYRKIQVNTKCSNIQGSVDNWSWAMEAITYLRVNNMKWKYNSIVWFRWIFL